MFVLNDVTRDRRVQKEAASLVAAGYEVTIIGLLPAKGVIPPAHERHPDGFEIVRIPLPTRASWRPSLRIVSSLKARIRRKLEAIGRRVGRRIRATRRRLVRAVRVVGRRLVRRLRRVFAVRRRVRTVLRWSRRVRRLARRAASVAAGSGGRPARVGSPLRAAAAFAYAPVLLARFARRTLARSAERWWERLTATRPAVTDEPSGQYGARAEDATSRGASVGAVLRASGDTLGRGVGASTALVRFVAFAAWSVCYIALVNASGGQIEWLLNVRERWLGWARRAALVAGPADVYHGHDLSALAAAVYARRRHGGRLVYDSHEVYLEAGTNGSRPRWPRWILGRAERRWFREADAVVTINRMVAAELTRRYGDTRVELVHNCPPRWTPPTPRPQLLRDAAGIPEGAPILLYHGGFTAVRGLIQMAEAVLEPGLEDVHLCYLGFGPLRDNLVRLAAEPRFGGRLHVLDPVTPDELDLWVASADVGMMPNQPETLNEIVSTPNKLFESIAAGVPVVTSDFPERRRIVLEDPDGPLGAVCDPTDPASIAAAVRSLVAVGPAAREELRARCLRAAHARWNWEHESERLLALYRDLLADRARPPA